MLLPIKNQLVLIKIAAIKWVLLVILLALAIPDSVTANPALNTLIKSPSTEQPIIAPPVEKKVIIQGPDDDFDRGTPQSSLKHFLSATNDGDNEIAAEHLDLRYLPHGLTKKDGPRLARKLKIVLDRSLWLDMDMISNHPKGHQDDGLPSYRDSIGKIKVGKKTINILLQHVPRKDGLSIWKFSNRTVGQIPLLYEYHGYSPIEEYLEGSFPDFQILGWHSWQWATYLILFFLSYLIALMFTAIASHIVTKIDTEFRKQVGRYLIGPIRITIWVVFAHYAIAFLGPSNEIRAFGKAAVLLYFTLIWSVVRLIDLGGLWFSALLKQRERHSAQVLLNPIKTFFKVFVMLTGLLLWLDNLGIQVSTLLASLGIGGLAFALASQDMLKNLLGSIMILIDRPYEIGQRIIAKGHDGIVEEIGLRSTKIRLLNGHQATIPNEDMAKIDIENIGRRPHIKRTLNIAIPLDTPVQKVEQALEIIKRNVANHECMHASFPPRVYFNEFNRDALNIRLMLWYRSSDYWAFQAFNQQLNLNIMRDFAAANIQFALPAIDLKTSFEQS
jgi:MscS family membrane protein